MFISRAIASPVLQQALRASLLRSAFLATAPNVQFRHLSVQPPLLEPKSTQLQPIASAGGLVPANVKWMTERLVSLQIALLVPSIFIFPSKALEATLVGLIVAHAHWGMQHIIVDYVPNKLQKSLLLSLYGFGGLAFGGFLYFILNDVGIAEALKQVWAI